MKKIEITRNDDNQKLIKFLVKYFEKAPKSLIQKWFRLKKFKVNGKRADSNTIIFEKDILDIFIYDEEIEKWKTKSKRKVSKINIDIAFENEDIIVFDKPQNLLVHASEKSDYGKNVVDYMIEYLIDKKEYIPRLDSTFRPALVNRIDRNTMGLVVGAKNRKTLLELNNSKDEFSKYYLAIVYGKIDKKIFVENSLEKSDKNFVRVSQNGKLSKTIIRPLKYSEELSVVEIELLTGRTHQIRATLNDINHSIIGDNRYFCKNYKKVDGIKDQQLVAYKIVFSDDCKIDSLRGIVIKSGYEKYILDLYEKLKEKK